MRLHVRSFRRLVTLALPCWLVGGPLAGTLQSVAACPHHDTMPSPMEHDAGSTAPCWCPNMSGAALAAVPTLPAANPEPTGPTTGLLIIAVDPQLQSLAVPDSPSFPPTPPPPNART